MWVHNLNPTLMQLGPFEIRYYGLVYVLGFLLAGGWMFYLRKKNKLNLSKDKIWDLLFYIMVGVLIGSRLFEVFWQPNLYLNNPLQFLKIWEGGMSFHGGLIGIIIATYWYCKRNKISFWEIADILSAPAIFALALGRIANFINGELVGRISSSKYCVTFPNYEGCRHPNMIYAAGKRFLIFFWLLFLNLKSGFKRGFIFWNFVFWEGLGRFLVDFYRQDVLYYQLTLGQWFSLVMVIVSLFFFVNFYKEDCKKIFKR